MQLAIDCTLRVLFAHTSAAVLVERTRYNMEECTEMGEFAIAVTPSPGGMAVDYEERVNFSRLREYRLARTREALENSKAGALLCFDTNNIRYTTSTQIGEWARDKMTRYSLLAREGDPMVWDFGSAAAHHRLHAPWLKPENCRAGLNGLRGAIPPDNELFKRSAAEIAELLRQQGVADMPLGVDIVEPPMLFALQAEGIDVIDGQQIMLDARQIKSDDEIMLLTTACTMVDGAYQLIADVLKNAAALTRTTSRIAFFAPAIRPSSTSSSRSTGTARVTTGPSTWAAPPLPSTMPTPRPVTGSTPRSA